MPSFIALLLLLLTMPVISWSQYNSPIVDGNISLSEYGDHIEGLNMLSTSTFCGSENSKWYITWDDDNLYIAVSNCFDASGPSNDAVNIYIDVNNHLPVNEGPGSDTGTYFDGISTVLPFHADFFAFAKNNYNAWRTWNSSWSGLDNNLTTGSGGSGNNKIIEISIPWNIINQNNGRPSEFNFIGFITYNCGVYADVPVVNSTNSNCGSAGSSEMVRYFTISETDSSASTKPFSRESYTHIGSDVNNFTAIDIFDFTMNSSGKTISRFAGNWNIAGRLVIHSGTVDFASTGDVCDVNGDCILSSDGELILSTAIGGDIVIGGNLNVDGLLNPNNRSIEFDGNNGSTSQTLNSIVPLQLDYVIVSNPMQLNLAADLTIKHDLRLEGGSIILHDFDLTLKKGYTISGSPASGSMIATNLNGKLIAEIGQSGFYEFPLGDIYAQTEYSPIQFNIIHLDTVTNPTISAQVKNNVHPFNPGSMNYLKRYWSVGLDNIDSINVNVAALYTDADIVGNEQSLYGMKYNPPVWTSYSNVNDAFNLLEFKNITSFSDLTGGDMTALPIALQDFSAETIDKRKVRIRWSTATETNNAKFELERSSDGKEFMLIHSQAGAGNSISSKHYATVDRNPLAGLNYYRLKQIDYDGEHTYSKLIYAEVEAESNGWSMHSHSTQDNLFVEIFAIAESISLFEVYDTHGRVLYSRHINLTAGKSKFNIPLEGISDQILIIRLLHENGEISNLLY